MFYFLFYFSVLLVCGWHWGVSFMHMGDKQSAYVSHPGWSQCLGLAIAIIIPVHTKPLFATKGMDYKKREKQQFGMTEAFCLHWRWSGYERQVLCSPWYLSVQGCAGEETSLRREVPQVGGLVLNWSMHVSHGDNSTYHRSAHRSNLTESGIRMHMEVIAGVLGGMTAKANRGFCQG